MEQLYNTDYSDGVRALEQAKYWAHWLTEFYRKAKA